MTADLVMVENGRPMTTSRLVAERFGKRHTEVLRAIQGTLDQLGGSEFSQRNFASANYADAQGKPRLEYHLSRDGFALIAMGFTGAEALRWKVAFIAAFNELIERRTVAPLTQAEKFWFTRRPHWPCIRDLALDGLTYKAIAAQVQRSAGSVGRSVRRMIQIGLIDPAQLFRAHFRPATAERLVSTRQLCLEWGQA